MNNLNKLLEISSDNISKDIFDPIDLQSFDGGLYKKLSYIYSKKNGFYALESSLLFLPFSNNSDDINFKSFNSKDGWKKSYQGISNYNVFALDVFGEQFGILDNVIYKFNPETGELNFHSNTFDEWAALLLGDYDFELGWQLAHDWQIQNQKSLVGFRLLPIKPFVIGGDYILKNMVEILIEDYIEKYIALYDQIKKHSDGQAIIIKNWLA